MPGVITHIRVAELTLERWRAQNAAPFDVDDSRCRDAFVLGSLGPDLGYFPGGDALLSEAAHRLHTGVMATWLLGTAVSPTEVAFACGWITHHAADVRLHPLVDREAARLARRIDDTTDGGAASLVDPKTLAHVRIEVGIDAALLDIFPSTGRRLRPALDASWGAFLARAFNDVYGPVTDGHAMLVAQQSVAHWHRCLVPLLRWMTADWSADGGGPARLVAPLLRARDGGWVRYIGAGPVAAAFVSPQRPSAELLRGFQAELRQLSPTIDRLALDGGPIIDHDLEDGSEIGGQLKPATRETLEAIRVRVAERAGVRRAA